MIYDDKPTWSLGHMDTTGNEECCETCGCAVFEALVRHGSYMLRCSACGEIGLATSWIAVGPGWSEIVKVFKDGETAALPLLEGTGHEIWKEIRRLASDGTTLVLR